MGRGGGAVAGQLSLPGPPHSSEVGPLEGKIHG